MFRLCLFTLLLLGGISPLFAQDIFPCRDQQGRLFVTDNPELLPTGCVLLPLPGAAQDLNVITYAAPSPASRGAMAALSRQEQQRLAREALWRNRAEELLLEYREGVSGIYQAGRSQTRRDARQALKLVREKARVLLAEVRRDGRQAVYRELEDRLDGVLN